MIVEVNTTGQEEHPTLVAIHEENNPLPDMPEWLEIRLNRARFEAANTLGVPIRGFQGAVEIDVANIDDNVPNTFPEYEGKTWSTYRKYYTNIAGTKCLIRIDSGFPPRHNRLDITSPEELQAWIDEFGIANVLLRSEARTLYNNDYRVEEEE